ncbi:ferrodoxin reductase-like protein, putative [Plasmodium ovale]|uniref:Ferrodoxin reductase-like protein, putative n=1 Tax=Plasmodium ovale TaxID=36330 RepID=A0A1C3KNB9_PLAOA|nr:ferrodoxin reductase-like protein, putative [Plasmodium ovale]
MRKLLGVNEKIGTALSGIGEKFVYRVEKKSVCHVGEKVLLGSVHHPILGVGNSERGNPFLERNQNKGREMPSRYNVALLLSLSLLCVPNFMQKRFNSDKNNVASCTNLEKVFLLRKDEIKEGEMVEVKVNGEKDTVLLVKIDGKYHCVGPKCPHYSAPLKLGILTKEYITCPWHDAKFDFKTGECINGPSFSDIPTYDVVIEGECIYAYFPKEIDNFKKKHICPCKDFCENKTILIVGGGPATLGAIETILKLGYTGKIIICSKDMYKPYDRTILSKNITHYSSSDDLFKNIKLKEDIYYNRSNIIYMNNTLVENVDTELKKVYLDNGTILNYDKILITTGLSPSPSPIKNVKVENLLKLYNIEDYTKLVSYAKEGSKCVIIGSSFIACELSSALKKRNVHVSIISKDNVPYYGPFGEKIGSIVLNILKDKNINFYPDMYPTDYVINDSFFKMKNKNVIHGVKLNNGEVICCDFVIEALGCQPNSQLLNSKFKNDKNFILVDEHFRVKDASDVYAAGDVCVFPYFITGEPINVCHYNVAIQQGRIAAHNMLSKEKKVYNFIPFFNTNIFGKNFRYSGFVKNHDKIIYEGDVSKHNFVAYFVKNDKVASILTLGNNKMAALNECLSKSKVPKVYELEAGLKNSDSMIASLKV